MAIDSTPGVLRWLKDRPFPATLEWGDDGLSAEHPYATRAADPVVADCPVMWPWHVVGPDEPEWQDSGSATLVLDYDIDVYELWPAGPCTGPLGEWIAGRDQPLDVVSTRELAELRGLPGTMLVLSGGWLPRTISAALEDWARTRTDCADIRFRWNPGRRSAVLMALGRNIGYRESAGLHRNWAVLQPAPDPRNMPPELEQDGMEMRAARKSLRVAHARRWARRMRVDPSLAWLTPAEVSMLIDLDPRDDVFDWAARHHLPTVPGDGIEPVLSAAAVLPLAQS